MKTKMQDVISQYGRMAIIVYFGIFFLSILGFWCLLSAGIDIRSWSWFSGKFGEMGTIALAYAATKILQPIRIALTLVITPLLAKVFSKDTSTNLLEPKKEIPNEENNEE